MNRRCNATKHIDIVFLRKDVISDASDGVFVQCCQRK